MERSGSAHWQGGLKEGNGTVSTDSQVLKHIPYSFASRFEGEKGTNPEELIAAAHAGCFSMAFAAQLEKAGYKPDSVRTTATLSLEKSEGGFSIPSIHLTMRAKVSDIQEASFKKIANEAKEGCPVSKLMTAKISLDATLEN